MYSEKQQMMAQVTPELSSNLEFQPSVPVPSGPTFVKHLQIELPDRFPSLSLSVSLSEHMLL